LLPYLALLSEILPIILYLCFAKRNKGEGLWVIFLYCVVSLFSEWLFHILKQEVHIFVFICFTTFEFTVFSFFFYSSLKEKRFKYVPVIGALIFYLIVIITFTNKKTGNFDSLSASLEAIFIIVYSIVFLYEQIKDPSVVYVFNTKKFWIIIAFFLYFSSTLFLFLYSATLTKQERYNYWYINNFFEILKNTFFCISFTMKKSNKTTLYSSETFYSDI
jgi:hypothetical protein